MELIDVSPDKTNNIIYNIKGIQLNKENDDIAKISHSVEHSNK
jgi:hypothetical protein